MIYQCEADYFQNKNYPLNKAILVIAGVVSRWCKFYQAKVIYPKNKKQSVSFDGELSSTIKNKREKITEIVNLVLNNSEMPDIFYLKIDDREISPERIAKFDHHDDTDCWVLNLELNEPPYELTVKGWSEDDTYPHTLTVGVMLVEANAVNMLQLLLGS